MEKKFIEWDLPLYEISKESAREKNIRHGHPSTLHIWWARKPLASSRATNFASLMNLPDSPKKREEIKELIKNITPWEAVKNGNSKAVKKAREMVLEQYDDPPKILDPFAGGGSIPLEALRLGCETYASDYNPVAVFIEKATLEWPQKYGVDIEISIEDAFERELKNRGYTKTQVEDIQNGTHQSLQEEERIEVNLLAHMVEKYANKVLEDAQEDIGQFYPEENAKGLVGKGEVEHVEGWIPVGFLWAKTIPCQNPNCNATIPLIKRFQLSKKENKQIAYRPILNEEKDEIDFEILQGDSLEKAIKNGFDPSKGTVNKANAECPICGQVVQAKDTRQLAREGKMGERLIVVVFHHPDETGKRYRLAKENDEKIFEKSKKVKNKKVSEWDFLEKPLPEENIPTPDKKAYEYGGVYYNFTPVVNYGYTKWKDLFNHRQQLSLITFIEKIKKFESQILEECEKISKSNKKVNNAKKLKKAILGYLSIIIARLADKNAKLVVWNSYRELIEHVFGRQALPMTWNFTELNVFSGVNGDWTSNRDWILRYLDKNNWSPVSVAHIEKETATNLPHDENTFDLVLTDPPYYDNVPYSALSDFFYVWLKKAIGNNFPKLFSTPLTPNSNEVIAETPLLRGMNKSDAEDTISELKSSSDFERLLKESYEEIWRVLKPEGTAVVVYAHKTTEGWETMMNSLLGAGLVVTASWPIHTERTGRLREQASAALASSIYMVCRKTEREELGFWKDIKPKIKERVEEKLHQFWNKGIVGGDFFISAIGPGMEIYSKYENVERYSGEEVTTLDLLKYIRSITTDFVVNNLLKDASPTEVDSASQFYLAYRWTYLDNKVEFDDARRIASGMGIELDEFSGKHGFVKQSRKYTSILGPQDREEVEKIDNMVDVMHKCVLLWDEGKQDEIKRLLSETGYGEKPAFWQFCQAVAETLLNGNKEKQLLEGFLTGKDKYSKSSKEDDQTGLDQFGGD